MMANDKKIVKSFKINDSLTSDIWEEEGGTFVLKPEIRKALLDIVDDYIDFIDMDLDIDDITLTGSLSNFNWSEFSDVDLHILVDFNDKPSLFKKYLDSRRMIWNSLRDITIKDFDVEIYVQDVNEPHFATGVYSVLYNDWIVEPVKEEDVIIDTKKILDKAKYWMEKIDDIEMKAETEDEEEVLGMIDKLKDKIKKYRSGGLKEGGEYSYENLAFKFLRRNEYLKKINDIKNTLIDRSLTIEGKVSSI